MRGLNGKAEPFLTTGGGAVLKNLAKKTRRCSFCEVLKSDPTSVISAGDEISAWRMGGSLKFHSGNVKHFLVAGVGFPRVGTDYLFFLRSTDARIKDYAISTAFSLSDQVVYSLDANSSQCAFDATRANDFLRTVREEILARRAVK